MVDREVLVVVAGMGVKGKMAEEYLHQEMDVVLKEVMKETPKKTMGEALNEMLRETMKETIREKL